MRKRYFLISFSLIVVVGVLIWACKYNMGPGVDLSVLSKNKIIASADSIIGYNGKITYGSNKVIAPNMNKAIEVFPFQYGQYYYRIPSLVVTTNGTLLAFADRRYNNRNDLPNRIEVEVKRSTDNGKKMV